MNPYEFIKEPGNLLLIPGCGEVRKGRLIMSYGLGLEFLAKWKSLNKVMADELKNQEVTESPVRRKPGDPFTYGVLVSSAWPDSTLGLFQSRYHWNDEPDERLMEYGLLMLDWFTMQWPEARIAIPRVAILPEYELPSNVEMYSATL